MKAVVCPPIPQDGWTTEVTHNARGTRAISAKHYCIPCSKKRLAKKDSNG